MLRILGLCCFIACSPAPVAQDTVNVVFVYGSRPAAKGEPRLFGGLHGGHVSVQYRDAYASFVPNGALHLASKQQFHSRFITEGNGAFVFDTTESRYAIVRIPVTHSQKRALDSVLQRRLKRAPYDYAFLGMRCASAAYEVLAAAGIFPDMGRKQMVRRYFYPKKLRKKLLKMAGRNEWQVVYRPGRATRRWEKD